MLEERTILNYVGQELSDAIGGNENDFVESNRQAALAMYLGQPDGNEVEGRSKVISTDVADAIEWIMPEIVKAFTQNNEVVTFDPVNSGDEDQAELESKFVYDILMKDNDGFVIIHQLVKDALMQKNGIVKVFYNEEYDETSEYYTGLTEVEAQVVLADPELELMELTENEDEGIPVFDIKCKRVIDKSKVCITSVPPEEFRVNRQHPSISLEDARFTSHVYITTASDLRKEGFSEEVVDGLSEATVYDEDREYRFYMQGETVYPLGAYNGDPSLRYIEIAESFMQMDINEDGIAEYVKVRTTGGDTAEQFLDIEEIDSNPFISGTCILMSHKFLGLSIYDRLKQIQELKTTLWRNIFDNMYLQNNQRTVAVEGQVNLDDLMVSRPGGIIRAKRLDAVAPFQTPPLGADSYKMMDYLDQVRAGRAGVSPEGSVTDTMVGDRVGSEGIDRMMNQKEELVGLMVRVIAETAIKPLCYRIRQEAMKHMNVVRDYYFRNQWVKVDPSKWHARSNTTVRVGTGSGNRKEQLNAIMGILQFQEKALANPKQALVKENQVFAAVDDYSKFAGLPGAGRYFIDPRSEEGKQFKQQVNQQAQQAQQAEQKEKETLAQAQMKIANAEMSKAQTANENVKLKAELDAVKNQLTLMKQTSDSELKFLEQQLKETEALLKKDSQNEDLQYKYWDTTERLKVERERIEATNKGNNNE